MSACFFWFTPRMHRRRLLVFLRPSVAPHKHRLNETQDWTNHARTHLIGTIGSHCCGVGNFRNTLSHNYATPGPFAWSTRQRGKCVGQKSKLVLNPDFPLSIPLPINSLPCSKLRESCAEPVQLGCGAGLWEPSAWPSSHHMRDRRQDTCAHPE